jgi:jumonji domain-containing protein 2
MLIQHSSLEFGCANPLRHKNLLFPPKYLGDRGITYTVADQRRGDFVIVLPWGAHQGINTGMSISESTNFAMPPYLEHGKRANFCDCPG